ncbi:MAG: hypothetical protein IKU02_00385, partial [Bacteroidaceae bacterium]|nr:hypothetical protein [Bacteroidaceae bacterium]
MRSIGAQASKLGERLESVSKCRVERNILHSSFLTSSRLLPLGNTCKHGIALAYSHSSLFTLH